MPLSQRVSIDLSELDVEALTMTDSGPLDLDTVSTGQGMTELTASSTCCASASCSCCVGCCCCCW